MHKIKFLSRGTENREIRATLFFSPNSNLALIYVPPNENKYLLTLWLYKIQFFPRNTTASMEKQHLKQ